MKCRNCGNSNHLKMLITDQWWQCLECHARWYKERTGAYPGANRDVNRCKWGRDIEENIQCYAKSY